MPHKCPHDLEKRQGEWRPEKQYLLVGGVICEPREEASRVGCLVAFYAPPPPGVSKLSSTRRNHEERLVVD